MSDQDVRPYANAAPAYFAAGWIGVLPVRGKSLPPSGWTGAQGAWPSYADVMAWAEGPEGELNVGLRLPRHVVGIDVDHYGGKPGRATLEASEGRWGALPPTWISTSRTDGSSGIRMFSVPEGLAWRGEVPGGGVEIIQYRHRYAVAWPSIHPEGRRYEWIAPDGTIAGRVPGVDDLPSLPAAWVDGLTLGNERDVPKADLGDAQAGAWLAENGMGEPCRLMARALERCLADLRGPASRHESATRGMARICHLITEGHAGGLAAVGQIGALFKERTAGEDRTGELGRLTSGAVRMAAVAEVTATDPCTLGHVFGTGAPSPLAAPRVDLTPYTAVIDRQGRELAAVTHTPMDLLARPGLTADALGAPGGNPFSTVETPQASQNEPDAPGARERTSYWEQDLTAILEGRHDEEPPAVLRRDDGRALFYLGRVNGLIGPSESGKSWVALAACAQTLTDGHHVTYLDFEDVASGIVRRLSALGVPADVLAERFHYVGPDEAPAPDQLADLMELLDRDRPRLVVLDGVNAAMAIAGLDLMSNNDATRFHQAILKPITADDRAVVYVDHTPKSREDESAGGIGAQAKRAMTSGCALRVDKQTDFGPGITGRMKLTVDKDRAGLVREISRNARLAGTVIIESQPGGPVTLTIEAGVDDAAWRPTELMTRVAEALERAGEPISRSAILREVKGKETFCRQAIDFLIADGYASETDGARGAKLISLERQIGPFGPSVVTPSHPIPTPSRDGVVVTSSHPIPTPLRSRGSMGGGREGSDEGDQVPDVRQTIAGWAGASDD